MKEDDDYVVSLKLPEVRKQDVQVEIRDAVVTVRATRGRDARAPRRRREAFARSFRLPLDADHEHMEASFADGTLTLRIQRLDPRRTRTLELR